MSDNFPFLIFSPRFTPRFKLDFLSRATSKAEQSRLEEAFRGDVLRPLIFMTAE